MSRKIQARNKSRNRSRINRLRPLSGVLAAGLSLWGSPLLNRRSTRPTSLGRSPTARGWLAVAKSSTQPAPK